MVHHGLLIKVSIACLRITAMQVFGQFQHIVGIAGLRFINVVDKVHTGIFGREVLTTAVAAESQCTLSGDDVPEEGGSRMIHLITTYFSDTLKAHHFRYLGIGMQIVETILPL